MTRPRTDIQNPNLIRDLGWEIFSHSTWKNFLGDPTFTFHLEGARFSLWSIGVDNTPLLF